MRAFVLFSCAVASLLGLASTISVAGQDDVKIGRIDRTYVRVAPGLFIERSLVPRARGLETWAEVRLPAQGPDDRPYEMARVENDRAQFAPGDVVEVRVSPQSVSSAGPFAEPSLVLRMVARDDPRFALAPGSTPARMAGLNPPICVAPPDVVATPPQDPPSPLARSD